jgi:drug/metabolite transporter (DMT)-like permease
LPSVAPRWAAPLGLLTGAAGLVGMFRNMTSTVDVLASVNNYLLPIWMIVFGVVLLRYLDNPESSSLAVPPDTR